jgi:hypothetical protein
MENQEIAIAQNSNLGLSLNSFKSLETAKDVQVEFEYFNVSKYIKENESKIIIVTSYIENGFEKDGKVTDMVEFSTVIDKKITSFVYSGSNIVRSVKKIMQKIGIETGSFEIPLKITYKGKVKGNNGFAFDSFEIVGLTNE